MVKSYLLLDKFKNGFNFNLCTMKYNQTILFQIIFIFSIFTTGFSNPLIQDDDSLVRVQGYVYDSTSNKIIGSAIITYEELPHGNSIGIINSENENGYFEFYTFGNEGYRVEIKADQYETIIDNIYPYTSSVNGVFEKDFKLKRLPQEGEIIILESLIFELGKSDITSASYPELNQLADLMKDNPEMIIQLEGHTDFRGSRSKNMELSEDRVEEVQKYLTKKGIEKDRVLTKAFGGSRPITRSTGEEAARLNRRVEVRIIKR